MISPGRLRIAAVGFVVIPCYTGCLHYGPVHVANRTILPPVTSVLVEARRAAAAAEQESDPNRGVELKRKAHSDFERAAVLYLRVYDEFPKHRLANVCALLAGRCFMLCSQYDRAIECFQRLVKNPPKWHRLTEDALYYSGLSHYERRDFTSAYRDWKKLTWEHPTSRYARTGVVPERFVPPEEDPEILKLFENDDETSPSAIRVTRGK